MKNKNISVLIIAIITMICALTGMVFAFIAATKTENVDNKVKSNSFVFTLNQGIFDLTMNNEDINYDYNFSVESLSKDDLLYYDLKLIFNNNDFCTYLNENNECTIDNTKIDVRDDLIYSLYSCNNTYENCSLLKTSSINNQEILLKSKESINASGIQYYKVTFNIKHQSYNIGKNIKGRVVLNND